MKPPSDMDFSEQNVIGEWAEINILPSSMINPIFEMEEENCVESENEDINYNEISSFTQS